MTDVRAIWAETSGVVLEAARDGRVGDQWHAASSLPGMTVAGLVGHLLHSGILLLELSLDATSPSRGRPLGVDEVFALIPADPSDPVHEAVEAVAGSQGEQGQSAVVEAAAACRSRLTDRLQREPNDRVISIAFGDFGVPMALEDFVAARVLELVVHLDDLTSSIAGLQAAAPPDALVLTSQLGIGIAIRRHGPEAVMRSVFRRGRYGVEALDPLK